MNALPDTVVIDGIERPTRNGAGRVIHDTPEGIANFWRWFGDSKAVDSLGRPLVVYHGTSNDFTAFSDEFVSSRAENEFGKGFYFTPGHDAANLYAGKNGKVVPSFVSMKSPMFVTTHDRGGATGWHGEHDGLIVVFADSENKNDPESWAEIVVASPAQIKSATDNSGRFDPSSPSLIDAEDVVTPAPKAKPRGLAL